ncbi:amidohydrolase [Cytobacillus kochii]|uniref:amidohydrolase n=1 Tax=Cytobacillus kochii TaxID=859143 RepID=UPI00203FE401|nr:amidohydrolase family protein [Cytobacillus kochii]MCM3320956.1 amidohydrolase family protein [Cytobacillus kochii]MCM3344211.1 amidohydrolase family protein [Cytobacillus kochii]
MSTILFKNAIVYPITSKPFHGDVLIKNRIVKKIGKDIQDLHAQVVDCSHGFLLPGFIDVHTHIGLYDEGTGWAGNDANETTQPLTPHIRAIDGIHPFDPAFRDALKAGITTVHVMPGSANIIGGTTSILKTYGNSVEEMLVKETAGLKIALGENPKKVHSHSNDHSITRMGIMGMLREAFYNVHVNPNEVNLRTSPIIKALTQEIPVRIHAHRADDILTALRFAKEFHLDIRIEHCTEGHLITPYLGKNLQVSVGPTLTRRSKVELKNKTWDTYKILDQAGVSVSITTDHPYTPIQYLNICASIAVREGLSEQKALEGITIAAAKNLKIDHIVGSIEEGKEADLVLWSHHPFHFLAKPKWTMVSGNWAYTNAVDK